jgi:iron(III) transport system substrate-binding protein
VSNRAPWFTLSALVAVLGFLTACSSAPAEPPAEQPPGPATLTIYSGRNEELVGPLIEQLRTRLGGANVEVRYGSTGEMSAQLLEEGPNSPADLFFSQDAGALGALADAGLLAPMDPATVAPAVAQYRGADNAWVATSGRARVVAYNPDRTPAAELPTSLEGLLDPRWRGQIGYAPSNASWLSFVTGLRLLRGEEGARQWLTAFAAQAPQRFESNGAIVDAVDRGTVALGLVNHYYLYEKTADIDPATYRVANHYVPNDPLGLVNVAGVGVLASSDQQQLAQQAVAFLLSPEGQQYLVDQTAEYPTVLGVTPTRQDPPLPPLESLSPPPVNLADLDSVDVTEQMLQQTGLL